MNPDKWQTFFLNTFGYKLVKNPKSGSEEIVCEDRGDVVLLEPEIQKLCDIESPFQAIRSLALKKNPTNLEDWNALPTFSLEWELECYQTHLKTALTRYLAFAVIEDDRKTVQQILNKFPDLLLFKGNPLCVTSELTTQSFSVSNILGIACRRKQIKMVKILLPYFDKLLAGLDAENDKADIAEITEIKNAGLAEWVKYRLHAVKYIQVPEDYHALINGLIDVFKVEQIAVNTPVKTVSDTVEEKMNVLYERLLPGITNPELAPEHRRVMTPKNHVDVELLLFEAYQAFAERFDEFQTWEQRSAYCIRVIGIVQNFLPPETGKIFCEGFSNKEEEGTNISARAEALRLLDGKTNFYCSLDLVHRTGLGFVYLIGATRGLALRGAQLVVPADTLLGWHMSNKYIQLSKLIQQPQHPTSHQYFEHILSGCVIC